MIPKARRIHPSCDGANKAFIQGLSIAPRIQAPFGGLVSWLEATRTDRVALQMLATPLATTRIRLLAKFTIEQYNVYRIWDTVFCIDQLTTRKKREGGQHDAPSRLLRTHLQCSCDQLSWLKTICRHFATWERCQVLLMSGWNQI